MCLYILSVLHIDNTFWHTLHCITAVNITRCVADQKWQQKCRWRGGFRVWYPLAMNDQSTLPPLVTGPDSFQRNFDSPRAYWGGCRLRCQTQGNTACPTKVPIWSQLGGHIVWQRNEFLLNAPSGIRTYVTGVRQQQYWPLRSLCALATYAYRLQTII